MNNSVIKPCSIKPAPGFRRTTPEEQDVQFREALHRNIMNRVYKQLGRQYLDKVADTLSLQIAAANGVQS